MARLTTHFGRLADMRVEILTLSNEVGEVTTQVGVELTTDDISRLVRKDLVRFPPVTDGKGTKIEWLVWNADAKPRR